ncbi:DUF6153 family protein [Streptomyces sp. NPDC004684]
MSSGARIRSATSRAGRALLVLAVLAGVFAMHALSPAGMPASGEHGAMTALAASGHATAPMRHPAGADRAPMLRDETCRQSSGASDSGGTAMTHAGGTCAAAGTSASYAPPAPLPAPGLTAPAPAVARTGPAAEPAGGRAPPDLAELQLLRI